jgi:arylsulfatase A-like enzyme
MGPALLASLLSAFEISAADKPNVIIVLTDDQGYGDVGFHGNDKIKTPNLDRFSNEGVELRQFYCSPVCAPTRASLLTGRYFYRTGVIHTSRGGAKMHGDETTLAEMLKPAGYATGIFGKWHLGDNYPMRPIDQGFDESLVHKGGGIGQTPDLPNDYFDPLLWHNGREHRAKGYCTDVFFNAAIEFVRVNRNRPFFVYLATNAPHTPLTVADRYVEPYKAMGLDDTTARVYGMVQNIDENLGRLLQTLEQLGLRRNTLVVFLSDNGPQQQRFNAGLRGRKGNVYEGGIRVPCFMQWPAALKQPASIDRIAAHIDIVPTVLAACGVKPPADVSMDGVSLLPLLRGELDNWPDRALFFQVHRGLSPQRYHNAAVRTPRYKLLFAPTTFGIERIELPEDPPADLYDLEADPGEQDNVASQFPDVVARLKEQYDNWYADVSDTRNFTPGVIHLGSDRENPAVLCRYQDSTYENGEPTTWSVLVERAGRYELTIDRGDDTSAAVMYLSINGKVSGKPLSAGTHAAVFQLPDGPARVDVWVQHPDTERRRVTDNSTVGNVVVRRLP